MNTTILMLLNNIAPRPSGGQVLPEVVSGTASTGTFELASGSAAWEIGTGVAFVDTTNENTYVNESVVIRTDTAGMAGRLYVTDVDENVLLVVGFKGDTNIPWRFRADSRKELRLAVATATGSEDVEVVLNGSIQ